MEDKKVDALELVSRGKMLIDFPFGNFIPPVIEGFKNFLTRPMEERSSWNLDLEGNGDPDDGYIRRDGGDHDFKDFLHFRQHLSWELNSRGVDFEREKSWLQACFFLHLMCSVIILDLGRDLDRALPGFDFDRRLRDSSNRFVLRLIRYDNSESASGVIAKAHRDRCFMTIHVWESDPGLKTGESRELYEVSPQKVLVFPSQQAERLTAGKLIALPHEVKQERGRTRFSIVFFSYIDTPA